MGFNKFRSGFEQSINTQVVIFPRISVDREGVSASLEVSHASSRALRAKRDILAPLIKRALNTVPHQMKLKFTIHRERTNNASHRLEWGQEQRILVANLVVKTCQTIHGLYSDNCLAAPRHNDVCAEVINHGEREGKFSCKPRRLRREPRDWSGFNPFESRMRATAQRMSGPKDSQGNIRRFLSAPLGAIQNDSPGP